MSFATLYLIIAGICWGTIAVFVRSLSELGLSIMEIVAVRCFFSLVILLIFMFLKDRSLLKIQTADMLLFCGTGIFSILFCNFCYFRSINILGEASVPALLMYTSPIFVMIMSFLFLGEDLNARKIFSVFLSVLGMCCLTEIFGGRDVKISGIIYGIGSGFGYSLYSIFGKFLVKKYKSETITLYTFVAASLFVIPFVIPVKGRQILIDANFLLPALGLAVLSTVIPYTLYTRGLQKTPAGKAVVLAMTEPVTATILGMAVYKEQMNIWKISGMILIFAAILIINKRGCDKMHREST